MDSTKLVMFSDWHLFNKLTAQNAPLKLGVYVMRMSGVKCFGRLRGKSDIIYIGRADKRSIKKRLLDYFTEKKI